MVTQRQCSVEGCEETYKIRKGLCIRHYMRVRLTGTTDLRERPTHCAVPSCDGRHRHNGLCSAHWHASKERCSVEDCDGPSTRRSLCPKHYSRWKKYGTPMLPGKMINSCTVDGCEVPSQSRGWCGKHYQRWQVHGDPTMLLPPTACGVSECTDKHYGLGYCRPHYKNFKRHGDPLKPRKRGHGFGPEHMMWLGDGVSYAGAHARVRAIYGGSTGYTCFNCPTNAWDWAYTKNDPNEKVSPEGFRYSVDPEYYVPLCRPCHTQFDLLDRRAKRKAKRVAAHAA